MFSSPVPATGWDELFRTLDSYLKTFAAQQWPLFEDGSGSETYVSLHRLYGAFPVPVDILLLDTDGIEAARKQERFATAIRYDFSRGSTPNVRFHGVVPLAEADAHAPKIKALLGLDQQSLEPLKDLSLLFLWDIPLCTHIVPYDARAHILDYCGDLATELSYSSELKDLFSPKIDYNAKYNLQPDPPLTDDQLLQPDKRNRRL